MSKHVKTLRGIGRIHFHTIHTQNQEICFRDLTESTRPAQTLRLKLMLREPHDSPDLVSNRYGKWAIAGQNWIRHRCQKSPAILLSSSRAEKAPNAESLRSAKHVCRGCLRLHISQDTKCYRMPSVKWQDAWQMHGKASDKWQDSVAMRDSWDF